MKNTEKQQEALNKLSRLKVGALFMEMGTGKTKIALDLMAMKQKRIDVNLWICPCSLKGEIEAERLKWHPELNLMVVGCESIGSSDRIYMELLADLEGKRTFIVVDESLKIKNRHAKRTQRILKIGESAKYKLVLNGTPVSKNILDIWAQMEFLSPKILNMNFYQFKDTYCEYYTCEKLRGKICRQVNIPHLISLIEPYIFECRLDIETEQRNHYWDYELNDPSEYAAYKEQIFNEYYNEYDDDLNFNAFAMKLQRFYCEHSTRDIEIQNIIDQLDGDKVIIFVRYLDSIPKDAHKITGGEKPVERKQILSDFKDGKFNVLYMTYGVGAYGLNLQFCQNIIFAEQVWDYALQVQAEARIFRLGQSDQVHYYHLMCWNVGLEDLMAKCISKKSTLSETMKREIEKQKGGIREWLKTI